MRGGTSKAQSGERALGGKARAARHPRRRCDACEGRGYVAGEDLGIAGMVAEDGTAIQIPCLFCADTASPEAPARRHDR